MFLIITTSIFLISYSFKWLLPCPSYVDKFGNIVSVQKAQQVTIVRDREQLLRVYYTLDSKPFV